MKKIKDKNLNTNLFTYINKFIWMFLTLITLSNYAYSDILNCTITDAKVAAYDSGKMTGVVNYDSGQRAFIYNTDSGIIEGKLIDSRFRSNFNEASGEKSVLVLHQKSNLGNSIIWTKNSTYGGTSILNLYFIPLKGNMFNFIGSPPDRSITISGTCYARN
jgi:hypothetical protein